MWQNKIKSNIAKPRSINNTGCTINEIISQCLVVCVPRFNLSLIDFVLRLTFGFKALTRLDLPTPEFPHNAEILPFSTLPKVSIPRFSNAEVNTILYPNGSYIEIILSCIFEFKPKSSLLKHRTAGIL